jgi:hypothetical protein
MAFGAAMAYRRAVKFLIALLALLLPAYAWAETPSPYSVCEAAIAAVEKSPRLPDKLMPAISRVESGRLDPLTKRVRPWPWTINVEGTGFFFDDKDQAMAAVRTLQARGVRSIDIGCMQVNLMHHPTAFASLDEAFEPASNARYAARFLMALYRQTGDWSLAAANYHSADVDRGEDYQRRLFGRVMTPMGPKSASPGPYGVWPPPGSSYAALPPVEFAFGAFGATPGRVAVQLPPLQPRR